MFTSLRYPTSRQGRIWLKRRQNEPPSKIAEEFQVSRPFVSKAQRIAEERIGQLLEHAASINRIQIQHLSTRYGIALGYCPAYQSTTYILYSPNIGVQIWFFHKGECGTCDHQPQCEDTLHQLAKEWEIPIPKNQAPTDLALTLFGEIKRRLKWSERRK
jgi:hypothetical protein